MLEVLEVLLQELVHCCDVVLELGVHLDEPLLQLVHVHLETRPRIEHLLEDEVHLCAGKGEGEGDGEGGGEVGAARDRSRRGAPRRPCA